jgi:DNA-binding NarL/FixJ family response regulator
MAILLISANPLFVEAISETLADRLGTELHSVSPEEALERILAEHTEVILVDEAIPPGMLKQILKQARRVNDTRLILLNCTDNDLIVLDSHPATIDNVDDLVKSIRRAD